MNKNKIKAFTLVELAITVTILVILATIGAVSYSSYLPSVRDTNRITTLKDIKNSLESYKTQNNSLATPLDQVEVRSSGSTIAYQGYIGKDILDLIKFPNEARDPKYDTYYSYYVTKDKKYFQLLGFLEKKDSLQVNNYTSKANAANIADYSKLFPTVYGYNLGILTDSNNTPIQENSAIYNSGYLDITTTNTEYIARLDNENNLTGTGNILKSLEGLSKIGGKLSNAQGKSCKDILDRYGNLLDGFYTIDPKNNGVGFDVYCDMTTNGGGWTRYVNIKGNFSWSDAKNCWLGTNINNSTLECFNPNRYNVTLSDSLMLKAGGTNYTTSVTSNSPSISNIISGSFDCTGHANYMTVMTSAGVVPDATLSNVTRMRFYRDYCTAGTRYIGGSRSNGQYANGITRIDDAIISEIYYR